MTAVSQDGHSTLNGGWRYAWIALIVLIVALTFGSCGQNLIFLIFNPGSAGDPGASFIRDNGPSGTVVVQGLAPASPLRAAGLHDGDRVRLDNPWDDLRMTQAGERFGLTDLSGGASRHMVVTLAAAPPWSDARKLSSLLTPIANMTVALIGLFVALRSRGDRALLTLATGLVLVGPVPPYLWPIPASHVPFWHVPVWLGIDTLPLFLLGFAMTYVDKTTGAVPAWQKTAFKGLVVAQVLSAAYEIIDMLLNLHLPLIVVIRPLNYSLQLIGLILPLYFFAVGWMKSSAEMRARYAIMFIALPITFVSQSIYVIITLFNSPLVDLTSLPVMIAGLGIFVGPLLFTYAIFRNRILNLGFAVNRTLVYGVVSVILLLGFGLIEWASEKFIPIESREKNLFVDAGIALGIFLTFHRVRDFVEHHIESFFFRSWHDNEARLRRFVKQAAYAGKAEALKSSFLAELTRFSGGAEAELFLAHGADFQAGQDRIDGDASDVLAMKADEGPVETAAALYLPMRHRAELSGFIRLGIKPLEDLYRPDETEVLAWATHQIGLDLHALKVEALESEAATLRQQVAELRRASRKKRET